MGRVKGHQGIAAGTVLAIIAFGLSWAGAGAGQIVKGGWPPPQIVEAELTPIKLPRSQPASATLLMHFTSSSVETPELERIDLEISRFVSFQASGLPSCSLAKLYSSSVNARDACAQSLVGHGSVTSAIAVPGQAPVVVSGHLLAFYALAQGEPRILAQVTTGEPLPLVYVIPFTMTRAARPFGTDLLVTRRRMRAIAGKCAPGHPNCFAPSPYTLVGVYSHISSFSMSLHRLYQRRDKRESFVSAECPVPRSSSGLGFPLLRVRLKYDVLPGNGEGVAARSCTVAR
jgi:hypothetical protein